MKNIPQTLRRLIQSSVLTCCIGAAASVQAAVTGTWNVIAAPGNWSDGSHWLGGVVPGTNGVSSVGDVAIINQNIAAGRNITNDVPVTLGRLDLGDTDNSNLYNYKNGSGGSLTFNNAGSPAQINELATSKGDTISADFSLSDDLVVTNASTNVLTLSGMISGAKAITLNNTAGGVIIMNGSNIYSGGTVLIGGVLKVGDTNALGAGGLTMGDATTLATSTGVQPLPNNISISGNVNVSNANNFTLSGVISGGGSLTRSGSAALVLSGVSTYTGGTTNTGGTLQLGVSGAVGTGKIYMLDGSKIQCSLSAGTITNDIVLLGNGAFSGAQNANYGGTISGGTGSPITNNNSATTTFSGNNTFTGDIWIQGAGNFAASSDAAMGNSANNIIVGQNCSFQATGTFVTSRNITLTNSGSDITVGSANVLTLNGNILHGASGGQWTKSGTGKLRLNSGSNTYAAGKYSLMSNGGLQLGHSNALNGTVLKYNGGDSLDNVSGAPMTVNGLAGLSLTGGFTFSGTDDLDLSGAQAGFVQTANNTKIITVSARTLKISGISASGTDAAAGSYVDAVLAKSGAGTLMIAGASSYTQGTVISNGVLWTLNSAALGTGNVRLESGGTLAITGTLALGGNLTNKGGTISIGLTSNPASGNDQLTVAGSLENTTNTTINLRGLSAGSALGQGTYTLITYVATNGTPNFALAQTIQNATLNIGATSVRLVVGSGGTQIPKLWAGGSGGNAWDVETTANWVYNVGGSPAVAFTNTEAVAFADGTSNLTVNLVTTVTPASVAVNSASNYVFQGAGGIAGTGGVTKSGSGTLTLSNANSFSGGITVNAGTLALGLTNLAGTPAAGMGGLTMNNNSTLQSASVTGIVVVTNSIALNGNVTFSGNNDYKVLGIISGAGSFTKSGTSALTLSNANTFSGGVTNNNASGALKLGNVNCLGTGVLVCNGGDLNTGGSNVRDGNSGKGITNDIIMLQNTGFNTLGDVIQLSGKISGTASFTLNGFAAGQLTLSGDNSAWSGNLTVAGGNIIYLGHPNALGTGMLSNRNAGMELRASVDLSGGNGVPNNFTLTTNTAVMTVNIANDLKLSGGISGDGAVVKSGAATLTLAGANTYTNTTKVSAGTLLVNGSLGGGAVAVTNSGSTLGGAGTIGGAVTLYPGTTLRPGSGGTDSSPLTVNGNVTLNASGMTMIAINRTNTPHNAATLVVGGTLAQAGTVTIANVGPALQGGDSFALFSLGALPTGYFAATNLPSLDPGLSWGLTNGTLYVLGGGGVNLNPSNLVWSVSGSSLTLTWPTNQVGWDLQAQTNTLSVGISNNWVPVPGSTGTNSMTLPVDPANPTVFYRLHHN